MQVRNKMDDRWYNQFALFLESWRKYLRTVKCTVYFENIELDKNATNLKWIAFESWFHEEHFEPNNKTYPIGARNNALVIF